MRQVNVNIELSDVCIDRMNAVDRLMGLLEKASSLIRELAPGEDVSLVFEIKN